MKTRSNQCPCGHALTYDACCGMYHSGVSLAGTAVTLMKSRYSAFAKSKFEYLLDTSSNDNRADELAQLEKSNMNCKWLELEIIDTEGGCESDTHGWVEFTAKYFENGKICTMRERSQFEQRNQRWLYVDGDIQNPAKTEDQSLNGKCYCGSGKKFKRCHGE